MLFNTNPGFNPPKRTLQSIIWTIVNTALRKYVSGKAGTYSQLVVATNIFTVTFGGTEQNTNYGVVITPANLLSSPIHYVANKTLTTFDVVYLVGLTGTVEFSWVLTR